MSWYTSGSIAATTFRKPSIGIGIIVIALCCHCRWCGLCKNTIVDNDDGSDSDNDNSGPLEILSSLVSPHVSAGVGVGIGVAQQDVGTVRTEEAGNDISFVSS